ncbi:hypothetical protein AB0M79_01165 [Polymorphospora sp. NPDC051019]|uniref:hypothetical protein n=1 Tax=Polymorphospora sp. NPDC051019 TaxID=3155725 RepID=UPI0034306AA2
MRAGWRRGSDPPPPTEAPRRSGIVSPAGAVSLAGIVAAAAAAVGWAVGLAVLQPLTEPSGPDAYAENNTYWVRDLRFMAIVAVVLGLVLAARGDRRATRTGVTAGLLWIGADVALDRSDLAGWPAATALAVLGCLAVGTVAATGRRSRRPDRRALVVAAAVGVALTPLAALIESPTDTEPALTPAALTVSGTLLVLTVGSALAAGVLTAPAGVGTVAADRAIPNHLLRRLAPATAVLALGAAGAAWIRLVEPYERLGPSLLLGVVLLAGLSLLSARWPAGRPAWDAQGATIVLLAIGYPVLTMFWLFLLMFGTPIATLLTALAGSVPVNSADTDSLYAAVGSATGLTIGVLLVAADRAPYTTRDAAALPDGS